MTEALDITLHAALVIHVLMAAVAVWRIWRGQNVIDRLIAADLAGTLALASLVLVSLITGRVIYIDVAVGLGSLGFVANILIAKYITDSSAH